MFDFDHDILYFSRALNISFADQNLSYFWSTSLLFDLLTYYNNIHGLWPLKLVLPYHFLLKCLYCTNPGKWAVTNVC